MAPHVEETRATYFLTPEWRSPEASTDPVLEVKGPGTRQWKWVGRETVHPFWAVQRMTVDQLMDHNKKAASAAEHLRFNMGLEDQQQKVVCAPDVVALTIPVLTNIVDVREGEVLIMQKLAQAKPPAAKKEKDWRVPAKRKAPQADCGQEKQQKQYDAQGDMEF